MTTLKELTAAEITELARGIVTGQQLVADLNDPSWQHSLVLLADELAKHDNLGGILVPRAPHAGGLWLNGTAPGVTLEARPIAKESLGALNAEIARMRAALYPQDTNDPCG